MLKVLPIVAQDSIFIFKIIDYPIRKLFKYNVHDICVLTIISVIHWCTKISIHSKLLLIQNKGPKPWNLKLNDRIDSYKPVTLITVAEAPKSKSNLITSTFSANTALNMGVLKRQIYKKCTALKILFKSIDNTNCAVLFLHFPIIFDFCWCSKGK